MGFWRRNAAIISLISASGAGGCGAESRDGLEFDAPDFDGDALIVSALLLGGGLIKNSKGASEGAGGVLRLVRVSAATAMRRQ